MAGDTGIERRITIAFATTAELAAADPLMLHGEWIVEVLSGGGYLMKRGSGLEGEALKRWSATAYFGIDNVYGLRQELDSILREIVRLEHESKQRDAALHLEIVAETSRAVEAEAALHQEIIAEMSRSVAEEAALHQKIVAETSRAVAEENSLLGEIVAETSRSEGAEAAIQKNLDEHEAATGVHESTSDPVANRIAMFDGRAKLHTGGGAENAGEVVRFEEWENHENRILGLEDTNTDVIADWEGELLLDFPDDILLPVHTNPEVDAERLRSLSAEAAISDDVHDHVEEIEDALDKVIADWGGQCILEFPDDTVIPVQMSVEGTVEMLRAMSAEGELRDALNAQTLEFENRVGEIEDAVDDVLTDFDGGNLLEWPGDILVPVSSLLSQGAGASTFSDTADGWKALDENGNAVFIHTDLGCTVHGDLTGREAPKQHPIDAIDGLSGVLQRLADYGDEIVARIEQEKISRVTADAALDSLIDGERNARIGADGALAADINAVSQARFTGDKALGNRISAEEVARIGGDDALHGRIDDEEGARSEGDAATLAAAKNYTAEEVAAAALATQKWLAAVDEKAALPVVPDALQTYLCRVRKDGNSDNNGVWQWIGSGSDWTFFSDNLDFVDEDELSGVLADYYGKTDADAKFQDKLPAQTADDDGKALIADGAGGVTYGAALAPRVNAHITDEYGGRQFVVKGDTSATHRLVSSSWRNSFNTFFINGDYVPGEDVTIYTVESEKIARDMPVLALTTDMASADGSSLTIRDLVEGFDAGYARRINYYFDHFTPGASFAGMFVDLEKFLAAAAADMSRDYSQVWSAADGVTKFVIEKNSADTSHNAYSIKWYTGGSAVSNVADSAYYEGGCRGLLGDWAVSKVFPLADDFVYASGDYVFSSPFVFQNYDIAGILGDLISGYWTKSAEMPYTAYYDQTQAEGYEKWALLCVMRSTMAPFGWERNTFKFNLALTARALVDSDGNTFDIETMINNIVGVQTGWESIPYQGGKQGHWIDDFIIYSNNKDIANINLFFGSYWDAVKNRWCIEIWACNRKNQGYDANVYTIKINSVEMIGRVDSYHDISYEYFKDNPLTLDASPAHTGRFAIGTDDWGNAVEMWTEITKQDGEGSSDHTQLTRRDAADQHPVDAITGLRELLDGMDLSIGDETLAREGAVNALNDRFDQAEHNLGMRIDGEEGARSDADAATLAASKNYTDEEVAAASLATQKWLPSVDTHSMLPSVLDVNQTYLCRVIRDQVSSNNGVWQWIGGGSDWTFFSDNLDFVTDDEMQQALDDYYTGSDADAKFQEKLPAQGSSDSGKALIADGLGGFSYGQGGQGSFADTADGWEARDSGGATVFTHVDKGSGGGGDHQALSGRTDAEQHPISAITDLGETLEAKANKVTLKNFGYLETVNSKGAGYKAGDVLTGSVTGSPPDWLRVTVSAVNDSGGVTGYTSYYKNRFVDVGPGGGVLQF